MKTSSISIIIVLAVASVTQATPICYSLVSNTDKSPFSGQGHLYSGEKGFAEWAAAQTGGPSSSLPFTKQDTSTRTVSIVGVSYVMLHWGNGQSGDHAYQLWDVSKCELDGIKEVTFQAPSQNGLSWVGKFGDPGTKVPDGGGTFALLGGSLLVIGRARRLLKRK